MKKLTLLEKCEETLLVDGYDKQGKNYVIVNSTSTDIDNHKQVHLKGVKKVRSVKRCIPIILVILCFMTGNALKFFKSTHLIRNKQQDV